MGMIANIALTDIEGEKRAYDLDIADRLGFERPRVIRELIERNLQELQRYGVCRAVRQTSGEKGGRPSDAYYLNEPQALLVATLSRTSVAADVREMLIRVFMAARRATNGVPIEQIVALVVESVHRHDEARERAIEERLVARLSEGAYLTTGRTPGELLREFGFAPVKGLAKWFGNRMERAGCGIGGRTGHNTSRARAFDRDKARAWLGNGGRLLVEQKIAERRGQGKLHLVGAMNSKREG